MASSHFPADQSRDSTSPEHMQLRAGQLVFNRRYELRERLGSGGMGVVWLARDHNEKAEVALKFLPAILVHLDKEMERLREEVRAGKELHHPLIVATYGLEMEGGLAAIVLEYVSGQTLKQKLEAHAQGFFEPAEIEPWLHDIASALSYLHEDKKRLHRDLKPANIIVDAEGRARLMDFGISQRLKDTMGRHSQTGQAQGTSNTLVYASPESLGLRHRPAVSDDIYSLGATLYELFTGTPPFYQGGPEVIALHIRTEIPPGIAQRRAELVEDGMNSGTGRPVPEAWEQVVQSCLAKDRALRPAKAGEVVMGNPEQEPPEADSAIQKQPENADADAVNAGSELDSGLHGSEPPTPPEPGPVQQSTRLDLMFGDRNSLGMKFVHFASFSDGRQVLGCIHQTRSKDFAAFIADKARGYEMTGDGAGDWRTHEYQGVPVGRGRNEKAEDSHHPVCCVSYEDAQAFCAWLTKKEGQEGLIRPNDEYRLPSDHEWSLMVGIGDQEDPKATPESKRGKIAGVYPWGTEFPPKTKVGNYADVSAKALGMDFVIPDYDDGYATTAPVMSFPPNGQGFHDLGGNAWEWCQHWFNQKHEYHVLRGASWYSNDASSTLSSDRCFVLPGFRCNGIGFRCVLVVSGG